MEGYQYLTTWEGGDVLSVLYPYAEMRQIQDPGNPGSSNVIDYSSKMYAKNMPRIAEVIYGMSCRGDCTKYGTKSRCLYDSAYILQPDGSFNYKPVTMYRDDVYCSISKHVSINHIPSNTDTYATREEYLRVAAGIIGRMYLTYPQLAMQYCNQNGIQLEYDQDTGLLKILTSAYLDEIDSLTNDIAQSEPESIEQTIQNVCNTECDGLMLGGTVYINNQCITSTNDDYKIIGSYNSHVCKLLSLMEKRIDGYIPEPEETTTTDDVVEDTTEEAIDTDNKTTDDTVEDTTEEEVDTDNAVEDTTDENVDTTTDNAVEDTTDENVDTTTDNAVEDTTDEDVDTTTDDTVDKPTNNAHKPSSHFTSIVTPHTVADNRYDNNGDNSDDGDSYNYTIVIIVVCITVIIIIAIIVWYIVKRNRNDESSDDTDGSYDSNTSA